MCYIKIAFFMLVVAVASVAQDTAPAQPQLTPPPIKPNCNPNNIFTGTDCQDRINLYNQAVQQREREELQLYVNRQKEAATSLARAPLLEQIAAQQGQIKRLEADLPIQIAAARKGGMIEGGVYSGGGILLLFALIFGIRKLHWPALVVLLFLVANSVPLPALVQSGEIRSINFNEFAYRVGAPYCGEFGQMVRVHEGKFANEKAAFEVSQVLYGNLTGAGREEAVVVASCMPEGSNAGFENNLVYVYGIENGRAALLATFAWGQPWNFTGRTTAPKRADKLMLFEVFGVSVGVGSISFDSMAGEAHCCPMFDVTQTFRWTNGRFVLASEQRRPWKEN